MVASWCSWNSPRTKRRASEDLPTPWSPSSTSFTCLLRSPLAAMPPSPPAEPDPVRPLIPQLLPLAAVTLNRHAWYQHVWRLQRSYWESAFFWDMIISAVSFFSFSFSGMEMDQTVYLIFCGIFSSKSCSTKLPHYLLSMAKFVLALVTPQLHDLCLFCPSTLALTDNRQTREQTVP